MADEIKQNLTEQSTWVRAFYMLIFFVIYSLAEIVLAAVIIFQFLSRLFTLKLNMKLLIFGADLSKFAYDILMFLTYNSDTKPFPFSEWKSTAGTVNSQEVMTPASKSTSKKSSTKKTKVTKIKQEKPEDDDGQNSGV